MTVTQHGRPTLMILPLCAGPGSLASARGATHGRISRRPAGRDLSSQTRPELSTKEITDLVHETALKTHRFDTSTLVGVLLYPPIPHAQAFRDVIARHQAVSTETMQELVEVLSRPKFDRYRLDSSRPRRIRPPLCRRGSDGCRHRNGERCRDSRTTSSSRSLAANTSAIISSDDDLLVLNLSRHRDC